MKRLVIGSNRQKENALEHGILPRLALVIIVYCLCGQVVACLAEEGEGEIHV